MLERPKIGRLNRNQFAKLQSTKCQETLIYSCCTGVLIIATITQPMTSSLNSRGRGPLLEPLIQSDV